MNDYDESFGGDDDEDDSDDDDANKYGFPM
jgi:hypothetical protein